MGCKWCELIIAIVIFIFAMWWNTYSKWVIIIAAIVLAIHSFMRCPCCKWCEHDDMKPMKSSHSRKRR